MHSNFNQLISSVTKSSLTVKQLSQGNKIHLQNFIDLFEDFFLMSEGKKGSAQKILKVCPTSKNPDKDKIVIGIYETNFLIGIVDLIQNYPDQGIWTIGYFLIHPSYQSNGKGQRIIQELARTIVTLNGHKLRCIVQKKNPNALKFWENSQFKIVKAKKVTYHSVTNEVYILEKSLKN